MPPAAIALVGVGVAAYTVVESKRQSEKAQSEAKKQRAQQERMFQAELEAGEYFEELTEKQMELQAQSSNIKTLANLIEQRRQPAAQQIITLPPAKEFSAVDQINQAIDKLVKG